VAGRAGATEAGPGSNRTALLTAGRERPEVAAGSSCRAMTTGERQEQQTVPYRIPRRNPGSNSTAEEPAAKKQKSNDSRRQKEGEKEKEKKRKKQEKKDKEASKRKKGKKNKRKQSSSESSSSSSSSSSEDESTESSSPSSMEETSSASEQSDKEEGRRKKKKSAGLRRKMCREDWETGVGLWALEDRPRDMRSYHGSAGRMKLEKLLAIGKQLLENANLFTVHIYLVEPEPSLSY